MPAQSSPRCHPTTRPASQPEGAGTSLSVSQAAPDEPTRHQLAGHRLPSHPRQGGAGHGVPGARQPRQRLDEAAPAVPGSAPLTPLYRTGTGWLGWAFSFRGLRGRGSSVQSPGRAGRWQEEGRRGSAAAAAAARAPRLAGVPTTRLRAQSWGLQAPQAGFQCQNYFPLVTL